MEFVCFIRRKQLEQLMCVKNCSKILCLTREYAERSRDTDVVLGDRSEATKSSVLNSGRTVLQENEKVFGIISLDGKFQKRCE